MGRRATRKVPVVEEVVSGGSEDEGSNTVENDDLEDSSVDTKKILFNPCTKKLFVVPKELDGSDWANVLAVKLPHPRTQAGTFFLIDDYKEESSDGGKAFVYEVLNFNPSCKSWFVDDEVCSDGNLRMVTIMDPLFLLIPAMSKSSQAKPLEDHLIETLPPKIVDIFSKKIKPAQLAHISEKRVAGDIVAYAFSEDLTLDWLKKKVDKTVKFLKEKNMTAMESSVSSNFTASSASSVQANDQQYLEYACDIVGDYLEISLKKNLLTKLGLPLESDRKRKSSKLDDELKNGNSKKLKGDQDVLVEPLENYGTTQPNGSGTPTSEPKGAKAKALKKAAQGSQSLFKFFAAKS